MVERPVIGWYRDPDGPDKFRYWDGQEWTAHATVSESVGGRPIAMCGSEGNHRSWYRGILRKPEAFRVLVWLDTKVPVARGHLGRFTQPVEQRTADQTWSLDGGR
jgi:hypothetical protein